MRQPQANGRLYTYPAKSAGQANSLPVLSHEPIT